MKKMYCILILLICFSFQLSAQVIFQKRYADGYLSGAYSVQQAQDGGFVIGGRIYNGFSIDALILKTDGSGLVQMSTAMDGGRQDVGYAAIQTAAGDFLLAGSTNSFTPDTMLEVYIARYNTSGNKIWDKRIGTGQALDESSAHKVRQTSDGGFLIAGHNTTNYSLIYLKTDSVGNMMWSKQIYGSAVTYGILSLEENTDLGFIMAGNKDMLIRTDSQGNVLWAKKYSGINWLNSARQTSDGGFIIAAMSDVMGAGVSDMVLIKTDSTGNVSWAKTFGSSQNDYVSSVIQTPDGGYAICGSTYGFGSVGGDAYLVKTDSNGDLSWSKTFGGNGYEQVFEIRHTSDGGYVMVGDATNQTTGGNEIYLIKTDEFGNSGCQETNPLTLVSSPVITVSSLTATGSPFSLNTNLPFSNFSSGINATTICFNVITGSDEMSASNDLTVYPNPGTGRFKLSLPAFIENGSVEVYSVLGELIYQDKFQNTSELNVNLEELSDGIYLLKFSAGKNHSSHKLVIRK